MGKRLNRGLSSVSLLGLVAFFLAGCSLFEKEKIPLKGERKVISALDTSILKAQKGGGSVVVPLGSSVPAWTQTDLHPSHHKGSLAFANALKQRSVVWSRSLSSSDCDARLLATPILTSDGGIILMGHRGEVICSDAQTGETRWQTPIAPSEKQSCPVLSGACAFQGDRVFVASPYGELLALSPKTGEILWRKELSSPARNALTLADGLVYVVTLQNQLQAFEQDKGTLAWTHAGMPEGLGILGLAAPAVDQGLLAVAYTSGEIYVLRAQTGHSVWSEILSGPRRLGEAQNMAHIRANPVIVEGVLYVLTYNGQMVAFNLQNGRRLWEAPIGGTQTPVIAGETVFVLSGTQELVALEKGTGQVLWVSRLSDLSGGAQGGGSWSGPLLAGGVLYVLSSEGVLMGLNPKDGTQMPGQILGLSDRFSLPPIVVQDRLYALSEGGSFSAIQ